MTKMIDYNEITPSREVLEEFKDHFVVYRVVCHTCGYTVERNTRRKIFPFYAKHKLETHHLNLKITWYYGNKERLLTDKEILDTLEHYARGEKK